MASKYDTYPNDMEPWIYDGSFVLEPPEKIHGFVYLITNVENGRAYVGRKYFYSTRKLKKSDKRRTTVQSDWRHYYGSCKELIEDIQLFGRESFKREIISFHGTAGQVNMAEIREQFSRNVLTAVDEDGDKVYYNGNIMSRYFSPPALQSAATREAMRKARLGREVSEERRQAQREAMIEWWRTATEEDRKHHSDKVRSAMLERDCRHKQETKLKISDTVKGMWKDPEYRASIVNTMKGREPWNKGKSLHYKPTKTMGDICKGKIRITDGHVEKIHDPDVEIPEGWTKGRPNAVRSTHKRCVVFFDSGDAIKFESAAEAKRHLGMKQSAFETLMLDESDPRLVSFKALRKKNTNVTRIEYV